MSLFFFILYTQAILKEELYEYQIGQMITNQKEDYLLLKPNANYMNFQNDGAKIHDEKVVLISEINHKMDKIIDMKQNEHANEDFVWILYEKDDKSILQKYSINELSQQDKYYLQLSFECYTFYFISKSQIAIDCQDSISNIIVLFDIQNKILQSFYYSYYKDVRLRKLLLVSQSNSLILIQKEQFIFLCFRQHKYQICNKLIFQNDAHAVHIYEYQITLISDYKVDIFEVVIVEFYEIVYLQTRHFNDSQMNPNHPILYYFHHPFNKQQYLADNQSLLICSDYCFNYELDGQPLQFQVSSHYFTIQTSDAINIFFMKKEDNFKIQHKFNGDFILNNKMLHEVLILNKEELKLYGLTMNPYTRIKNQIQLIKIDDGFYIQSQIYDKNQDYILLNEQFRFKRYFNIPVSQNTFVAIGGALNVTIHVEDQYKDLINIQQSYFRDTSHTDVLYYFFVVDQRQDQILVINKEYQIIQIDIYDKSKNILKINNQIYNLACLNLISSFNDVYYIYNTTSGQYFVMRILLNEINLYQFQCAKEDQKLLYCNNRLCVCQNTYQIYVKFFYHDHEIYLQWSEEDQVLNLEYVNDEIVLYIKRNNKLEIKYYHGSRNFFNEIHTQTIKLCNNFINLVIFLSKLILVCSEEIILYNKLSNFRFIISGNVELFENQFKPLSKVVQSNDILYYIIDNDNLHVFNSFLPLNQQYITKIKIGKYNDVKVHNKHICFQQQNNLKCYYYQINIKFNYETDQVEYHQAFKVNVCVQNKYDKKCQQYITRLDQQNRKIAINKNIYQLVINQNTKKIKLDSNFFSGSIDKIFVNQIYLKSNVQVQSHIQTNSDNAFKSYYNRFQSMIYIINNQTLIVYNLDTGKSQSINTKKRMQSVLPYKNNLILIGPNSIIEINCELECKEIQYREVKIPQQGFIYIINNTLYSAYYGQLRTYNLDDLSQNKSIFQIYEESYFYFIDMMYDKNGQNCMVQLSFNGTLVFKHQQTIKSYQILYLLKQRGIHIDFSNPDAIHSAKILDDCRLVLLGTGSGYYFLELSDDIIFRAELVGQDPKTFRVGELLIGQSYLFYIQILSESLAIYRFTQAEIYHNKFIDFCKKIYKPHIHYDQTKDYIYVYKDELYSVKQQFSEYIISKIDLDTEIYLENKIRSKERILVELNNSDETRSFIIELQVQEYDSLLFVTVSGFLITFYILLIYYKIRFTQQ